jgi:hypothetical protein
MTDENLRTWVQAAMKAGKLPAEPPERIWGGPGCGAACAVCGKAVGEHDVEFELQFTSESHPGASSYHMHIRCFAAWEVERRHGSPNGHSLPAVSNGGIMPGRERDATNQGERR